MHYSQRAHTKHVLKETKATLAIYLMFLLLNYIKCTYGTGESPSYLGCFVDTHDRILNGFEKKGDSHMTVTKCISICKERMFPYAGVQFSTACFCGDKNTSAKRPESECNMPCSGDKSKICGGSWRNSVYSVK